MQKVELFESAIITLAPQGSLIRMSPKKYKKVVSPSFSSENIEGYKFLAPAGDVTANVALGSVSKYVNGTRKEIVGFSRRSRSRLNMKMAMLKKHHIPVFVTLTYHKEYPDNFSEFKSQLDMLFMRLDRRFSDKETYRDDKGRKRYKYNPYYGAIWKMEYQKRGAPHYHLLLWGIDYEEAMNFIPYAWNEIAGYGSELHLKWHLGELGNEPCVTKIRSWGGVVSYASKYMSKIDNEERGGRVWGVRGKVPYSSMVTFHMDMETALEFRKALEIEKRYLFQRVGFWCNDYEVSWLMFLYSLMTQPSVPDDPPDWELFEYLPEDDLCLTC